MFNNLGACHLLSAPEESLPDGASGGGMGDFAALPHKARSCHCYIQNILL